MANMAAAATLDGVGLWTVKSPIFWLTKLLARLPRTNAGPSVLAEIVVAGAKTGDPDDLSCEESGCPLLAVPAGG